MLRSRQMYSVIEYYGHKLCRLEYSIKNVNCPIFLVKNRIITWITINRKSGKHCAPHIEPLDSCFDLISPHQQCLPKSLQLKIERATTECRAETLPLNYSYTSRTSAAKLTSLSIHYWWDVIKSKQQSSCSACHAPCLQDFLVLIIQFIIYNSYI